jgi:hypothetical protein
MMVMELTACHVPVDPTFLTPVDGYVVTFMAFYECRFGAASHWFLRSLLR